VKYAWVERHQKHWPISLQCDVLNVSTSGYFEHHRRKDSVQPAKLGNRLSDDALLAHIRAAHAGSKGEYGWPRIWKELIADGVRVGKERIQRLMKLHGTTCRLHRTCSIATSSPRNPTRYGPATSPISRPMRVGCTWRRLSTYTAVRWSGGVCNHTCRQAWYQMRYGWRGSGGGLNRS
jgi:hypothetical protein